MSLEIMSWNTWKRKYSPKFYQSKDWTLGHVYTIQPTLSANGFLMTRSERNNSMSPKEQAKHELKNKQFKEAVYNVYRHPRGYGDHLEVFYR